MDSLPFRPYGGFMSKRTLTAPRVHVAYATTFGTTGEIAADIANVLRQRGNTVTTGPIGDGIDSADIDALIIGAPIHYDTWTSPARNFVKDNEAFLRTIPVAYFFTCGTLFEPTGKALAAAQKYANTLERLSDHIAPVSIGQFAGVLDYSRMNLATRIALKIPFTLMGVAEGDYRNWDAIRSWTLSLHRHFRRAGGERVPSAGFETVRLRRTPQPADSRSAPRNS